MASTFPKRWGTARPLPPGLPRERSPVPCRVGTPQRRGRSPALSLHVPHRYKDGADSPTDDGEKPRVLYSPEFTFDADARVAITVYCQAVEEFLNGTAA